MAWPSQVRTEEPDFERIEESRLEGERSLPGIRERALQFCFRETWKGR